MIRLSSLVVLIVTITITFGQNLTWFNDTDLFLNDTFNDTDLFDTTASSGGGGGGSSGGGGSNNEPCEANPYKQCKSTEYWLTNTSCSQWNFSSYENQTITQDDFSTKKKDKWRAVMWFNDEIWSGTLQNYQKILQLSFTNAVMDLHYKWKDTNASDYRFRVAELSPNDLYVNVTFFLGFCLLEDTDDCDIITEAELKDYDSEGAITGNRDSENAPYYVYSVIHANEEKIKYIHHLMETYAYDYMSFASMRIQCNNFSNLIGDNDIPDIEFEGWALYVEELDEDKPWGVPDIMNYAVAGFVGFCFLFAAVGFIHGYVYWKADCIRISGIIYFGLYTWDFYSDIVFTLSLWDPLDCDVCSRTLFYAAATFVVVPWIANMIALSRYQNKWCKDETIRERVYQWFVSWQRLTYALAALSGSAFGTVELANSYVFGLDFFCMGLNERHLKKFNNNRLYSSILVENAPQICIQIIYLMGVGWDQILGEQIALTALCASTLSVGAALLDIYASKKLFSVLKKDGEYVGKTSCSMFVISPEIKANATRLQISTYAFREAIAETLSTHPRSVEMHFPIATSTGFKIKFTVFSSKLQPDAIDNAIRKGSEDKLPKRIQQVWRLMKPVAIPTDRIEVEKVENNNGEGEGLSAPLHSNLEGNNVMMASASTLEDGLGKAMTLGASKNDDGALVQSNDQVEIPIRHGRLSKAEGFQ